MSQRILTGEREWPTLLLARADGKTTGDGSRIPSEAWEAMRRAVTDMSPDGLIRMVSESGLTGRGGGGFPAGRKWRAVASGAERQRYVVANGFEADPGAAVDRTLMECDPHAVIEGAALAAWAVGADEVIVVVRSSATEAAARLSEAIGAAEAAGLLGPDAAGSGRTINVTVRQLTGSFVLGEETVLLRALESRRAQPDQRPPYPSESGLWGKPTLVHNVKTLACLPAIVRHGAAAFASIGHPEAPGTLLVQVGGAVKVPGIVEVPSGTSLRRIIEGPAGGTTATLKALLVGGPVGGFLPPGGFDTPLLGSALAEAGAVEGSGTLLAVDRSVCLVELAGLMTRYLSDEACGKTIPCRIGTRRLVELGEGFCSGRCRPTDARLLTDLAADMRDAALCGLEADAANPLLSGMRYFSAEFEDHIVRGSCPAGSCRPQRAAATTHA